MISFTKICFIAGPLHWIALDWTGVPEKLATLCMSGQSNNCTSFTLGTKASDFYTLTKRWGWPKICCFSLSLTLSGLTVHGLVYIAYEQCFCLLIFKTFTVIYCVLFYYLSLSFPILEWQDYVLLYASIMTLKFEFEWMKYGVCCSSKIVNTLLYVNMSG